VSSVRTRWEGRGEGGDDERTSDVMVLLVYDVVNVRALLLHAIGKQDAGDAGTDGQHAQLAALRVVEGQVLGDAVPRGTGGRIWPRRDAIRAANLVRLHGDLGEVCVVGKN